jgi:hypothetical protein
LPAFLLTIKLEKWEKSAALRRKGQPFLRSLFHQFHSAAPIHFVSFFMSLYTFSPGKKMKDSSLGLSGPPEAVQSTHLSALITTSSSFFTFSGSRTN